VLIAKETDKSANSAPQQLRAVEVDEDQKLWKVSLLIDLSNK